MLSLWIATEILLGIALAFIVTDYARVVGLVLTLSGVVPITALSVYTYFAAPARDMSMEGMLSTMILVMVTPVGLATLVTGVLRGR